MRYYYGQLSRPLQGVYDALLGGFRALAPGIRIPMLDEKQLADVYLRLKLDEPLLFYVTGYRCRWMTGAAHMELLPEYLFDKAKIRTHQQAVSARLARLTKPLEGKTEAEKELAVHDFILENVRYDKLKKPYSHEILGPMTQGVGVCEGIAKTVKALCDQLGLWCIVALSEADPARGIKYRHTWNVVRVGGQYYHLDATFDNSLQRGEKRYDYYNLDDGRLFRDHTARPARPRLHGWKTLLLSKRLVHEAGGAGKAACAGTAQKAAPVRVPLARRRPEPGHPAAAAGACRAACSRTRKTRVLLGQFPAGRHPARILRSPAGKHHHPAGK